VRVAVDVTPLIAGSTGVARYTERLCEALEAAGIELAPFAVGRASRPPPPGARHLKLPLRIVQRSWSLTSRPSVEALVGPVDVVHSLDLHPPPSRHPIVATVHDLAAIEEPNLHPPRSVAQQRVRLAALGRAEVVVSDSYATAAALSRHGIEAHRIVVGQLGLTPLPAPADHGVAGAFVLAVGELSARKGHAALLEAFASACLGPLRLVLAGPDAGQGQRLRELAVSLGIADRCVIPGRVSDAVLAGLYEDATALCFPSLAEGFGLPVLEAMAAGLPVVASDLEVIREVAGDAAVFVPAGDVPMLRGALEQVVNDEQLRRRLADNGRTRAGRFTWEATADATISAYQQALACV
jgi:glycosyltransferase involved in cell wall biosynthesis